MTLLYLFLISRLVVERERSILFHVILTCHRHDALSFQALVSQSDEWGLAVVMAVVALGNFYAKIVQMLSAIRH
jgi:hypothetical protein